MPEEEKPARKGGRIVDDSEILAMHDCNDILATLEPEARARVMMWLNARCGVDRFEKTVTEGGT